MSKVGDISSITALSQIDLQRSDYWKTFVRKRLGIESKEKQIPKQPRKLKANPSALFEPYFVKGQVWFMVMTHQGADTNILLNNILMKIKNAQYCPSEIFDGAKIIEGIIWTGLRNLSPKQAAQRILRSTAWVWFAHTKCEPGTPR